MKVRVPLPSSAKGKRGSIAAGAGADLFLLAAERGQRILEVARSSNARRALAGWESSVVGKAAADSVASPLPSAEEKGNAAACPNVSVPSLALMRAKHQAATSLGENSSPAVPKGIGTAMGMAKETGVETRASPGDGIKERTARAREGKARTKKAMRQIARKVE